MTLPDRGECCGARGFLEPLAPFPSWLFEKSSLAWPNGAVCRHGSGCILLIQLEFRVWCLVLGVWCWFRQRIWSLVARRMWRRSRVAHRPACSTQHPNPSPPMDPKHLPNAPGFCEEETTRGFRFQAKRKHVKRSKADLEFGGAESAAALACRAPPRVSHIHRLSSGFRC